MQLSKTKTKTNTNLTKTPWPGSCTARGPLNVLGKWKVSTCTQNSSWEVHSQPFRTLGGCLFWTHFNGSPSVSELHFSLCYPSTTKSALSIGLMPFHYLLRQPSATINYLVGCLSSFWRVKLFLLVLFKLYVKGLPRLGYYSSSRVRRTSLWEEGRKNFKKGPRPKNLRTGTLLWKGEERSPTKVAVQ